MGLGWGYKTRKEKRKGIINGTGQENIKLINGENKTKKQGIYSWTRGKWENIDGTNK